MPRITAARWYNWNYIRLAFINFPYISASSSCTLGSASPECDYIDCSSFQNQCAPNDFEAALPSRSTLPTSSEHAPSHNLLTDQHGGTMCSGLTHKCVGLAMITRKFVKLICGNHRGSNLTVDQQTHELEIEEDFFLAQLHKTTALFDLGKRTMAATMARKAITLLKTIIQQIELRSRSAGSKNWDRRKKGPAVALETNQTTVSTDGRDEVIKRKQPKVHTKSHEPANFQFQQYEFGMPSAESPQTMQHNRQRSGQPAMHSISSSDSVIPISQVMIPTHASSSITSHHLGSSTAEAFSVQPTPPSVPSQPSQRPGFSTHSSSSQFSLTLDNTCLDRLNSGPSIRPIVNLPRSYYLNSTVEFGKFNTQLDNHQFEFRALQSFPQVYVESGGHAHAGAEEVGAYNTNGQTNRLDNPEFLLPQLSCSQMESASSQSAGSLAPFEPTFNLDFGLTDAVVSTASLADLAHPPGFLGFAPDPQTRSAIDELGPHEINNPSRGCFRRRGSHQPPQQTANIVTTTTATTDHYVDSHAHYHHPYFGLRYRPSQNPHG
ncbi:uncharacterized protein VP01_2485g1 [Puccinia sorghi]|uniref:Uncharacterized protein n=1 Tax=Puccinia sorghi TaxID=27349 RepID=A0A0L6V606_9BASI|nr:uncharacterized protein VP01_2485g1 [Puccinia sorghi]